jgi:glyoxylase-like metal-dependent hydrolase (beta-lactamase superfamily II)
VEGRDPVRLDPELLLVPVPGHTRGSLAISYRDRELFTGDHLWWDHDLGRLSASRSVCWFSWPEQTRSMERLADVTFTDVLPGHGRRWRASSAAAMRTEVLALAARMKTR